MPVRPPRVFISYSHDSPNHMERVRSLADRLRSEGVDAWLDQYEISPTEGWPRWMERHIVESDFVLVVCTETYRARIEEGVHLGKGLGARWEIRLIYQHVYEAGMMDSKFVPVVFGSSDFEHVLGPLRDRTAFDPSSEKEYRSLFTHLTGRGPGAPPLGDAGALPQMEARWRDRPPHRWVGVPPAPPLFIGRDGALEEAKRVMGILAGESDGPPRRISAISGAPGVGKTCLAVALARDPDVLATFPDGVFWAPIGQVDDVRTRVSSMLSGWGRPLDLPDLARASVLDAAVEAFLEAARQLRLLVIVDDVWTQEAAHLLGGLVDGDSAIVLTTRVPKLAEWLVPPQAGRYVLPVLDEEASLGLLEAIAPEVVAGHRAVCRELARDLGCLPLALHIAGRLLGSSAGKVHGVRELIEEIREGSRLLEQDVPPDMVALQQQTTPTVAALLAKSTDVLPPDLLERFADLGAFASKPATFDLGAMSALWMLDDPRPIAIELVGRGLIEAIGEGRFQMHALLTTHAKSMRERPK